MTSTLNSEMAGKAYFADFLPAGGLKTAVLGTERNWQNEYARHAKGFQAAQSRGVKPETVAQVSSTQRPAMSASLKALHS